MKRVALLISLFLCAVLWASAQAQPKTPKNAGSIFQRAQATMGVADQYLDSAKRILKLLEDNKGYQTLIGTKSSFPLPIKIPLKNPSDKYEIALGSLVLGPQNAAASVYMSLDPKIFNPKYEGQPLYFCGKDILFTRDGGFTGDATMILLNQIDIPMGNKVTLTLFPNNPTDQSVTYAKFNCDGFEELHVSGGITFHKDIMRKEDASGKTIDEDVTFYFETTIKDWDDWIIELNEIPAFQLTDLAGFSWAVDAFVLDKSLSRNSSDFELPNGYEINGPPEMWNGVFFRNITVKLPREFKEKGDKSTERRTISGSRFLIDQEGITGELLGTDIIKKGDIGRWTYTLDTVQAAFVKNGLVGAGFAGTLDMPLAKDSTEGKFGLAYKGSIAINKDNDPEYTFNVKNTRGVDFSMLSVAKVEDLIFKIDVRSVNGNFSGQAELSGKLIVTPSFKKQDGSAETKKTATALAITVQELVIKSSPSYFVSVGEIGIQSSGKSLLSKLPVGIDMKENPPRIIGENGTLRLEFNLFVNIMKSDGENTQTANGFSASGKMVVWAKENVETGHWDYDRTDLEALCVKVVNGGFNFQGCISRFSEKPMYGEGFQGNLKASFPPGINVEVSGMFGRLEYNKEVDNLSANTNVEDDPIKMMEEYDKTNRGSPKEGSFRYWFIDGSVEWPTAINIFPGVAMDKFMGGAYHNMTLDKGPCTFGEIGCSNNGAKFIPNSSILLGVRAGIGIVATGSKLIYNGDILFGIEFHDGGGLHKIYFDGLVKFIKFKREIDVGKIKEMAKKLGNEEKGDKPVDCETGIAVGWHTEYNFSEKTLSGTFDVKINLADVIVGTRDATCTAGKIELYFSERDWYLYIGRPNAMNGIEVVGVVKVQSYFIAGSILPQPAIAPLPGGLQGRGVDPSLLPTGGGLGFGVRLGAAFRLEGGFEGDACTIKGGVNAGFEIGMDFLIAKDKQGIDCGQGIRGINQWYATGQAYLLAWGEVFVNIKCFGVGGSGKLFSMYASALMYGQLPKPTWFEGELKGGGSICGVSVSAKFDFKYGDKCHIDESLGNKNFDIVQLVFPEDTLALSSVYTSPRAMLKYAVDSKFSMTKAANNGNDSKESRVEVTIKEPKFEVKAYSLRTKQTIVVEGRPALDNAKTTVSFVPKTTLPDSAIIYVKMTVYLQAGSDVNEMVREWKFKTIPEPMLVDNGNIQYAYPLPNMTNLYPATTSSGYICFNTIPSRPLEAEGYSFKARYLLDGKVAHQYGAKLDVKNALQQLEFSLPPKDSLKTNKTYTFQIVKVPSLTQTNAMQGTVAHGMAGGNHLPKEAIIIEYPFTTSLFGSFEEKMAAFGEGTVDFSAATQGIVALQLNTESASGTKFKSEGFSLDELKGYAPSSGEQQPPSIIIQSQAIGDYKVQLDKIGQNNGFKGFGKELPQQFPPYDAVQIIRSDKGFQMSFEVAKYINQGLLQAKNTGGTDPNAILKNAVGGDGNVLIPSGVYTLTARYYLPGRKSSAAQVDLKLTIPTGNELKYQP